MAKDEVATMGEILTNDVGGRDAVHVAVISVVAGEMLVPGDHVGFKKSAIGEDKPVYAIADRVGIVDPYLKKDVQKGQRFWLYLYPRTITSLRHNWTHPIFADAVAGSTYVPPATKLDSEKWLRNFCADADCPAYDTVIELIAHGSIDNNEDEMSATIDSESMRFHGRDASGEIPPEFWTHVENVLGHAVKHKPSYFSCSC